MKWTKSEEIPRFLSNISNYFNMSNVIYLLFYL